MEVPGWPPTLNEDDKSLDTIIEEFRAATSPEKIVSNANLAHNVDQRSNIEEETELDIALAIRDGNSMKLFSVAGIALSIPFSILHTYDIEPGLRKQLLDEASLKFVGERKLHQAILQHDQTPRRSGICQEL